jgi:hypothetical protein
VSGGEEGLGKRKRVREVKKEWLVERKVREGLLR